ERHDVGADAEEIHQDERDEDGDRQRESDDENAAEMPKEDDVSQRDENDFLNESMAQRIDGAFDKAAAVVEGLDGNAGGETGGELGDFLLHSVDHLHGVFAGAHHNDAADHFAAIDVERAAAEVATHLDHSDVP